MTVLDVSNYDGQLATECLAAAGVTRVIVGCQRPTIANTQIEALRRSGIEVRDLYAFLYFGLSTQEETAKALGVAQRQGGIDTIWLDCESTGDYDAARSPTQRIDELTQCVKQVEDAGYRCGIYTGGWWWPTYMRNSSAFAHLPLWHSAYYPDRREVRTVDYGGWTNVAIHQYASDIIVCGRVRDHNYVFEEEDVSVREDLDKVIRALGGMAAIDDWNTLDNGQPSDNSLLAGYTIEQKKLDDHIHNHPNGNPSSVPDHKHIQPQATGDVLRLP